MLREIHEPQFFVDCEPAQSYDLAQSALGRATQLTVPTGAPPDARWPVFLLAAAGAVAIATRWRRRPAAAAAPASSYGTL